MRRFFLFHSIQIDESPELSTFSQLVSYSDFVSVYSRNMLSHFIHTWLNTNRSEEHGGDDDDDEHKQQQAGKWRSHKFSDGQSGEDSHLMLKLVDDRLHGL